MDPWKEDALAAIAHGLDQDSRVMIVQAERLGLRNEATMGLKVALRQGMYGEVELRNVGKKV